MRKLGVLLALLVLLATLSVSTTVKDVSATGGLTSYFVDISMSKNSVESVLNSTTWKVYTPQIVSIVAIDDSTTRVYLASEVDLVRFLIPPTLQSTPLFDFGRIKVSEKVTLVYVNYYHNSEISLDLATLKNFSEIVHTYIALSETAAGDFIVNGPSGTIIKASGNTGLDVFTNTSVASTSYTVHIYQGDAAVTYYAWIAFVGDTSFDYKVASGVTYKTYALEITPQNKVFFSIKDALTGQPLTSVTVKEGNSTLGTLDDGSTLELDEGVHNLTFEKAGYWSVTRTIDVQNDMTVAVEMYPSSAAFKFENFPSNISIPENTLYTLTFTISPISKDITYNTYLSISGLQNLIEVQKDGSTISPEGGKYYLGDISGPTQVSIKFKAGAVGQHGFTMTLTSNDAIQSKTHTTTKSITYQVELALQINPRVKVYWKDKEQQGKKQEEHFGGTEMAFDENPVKRELKSVLGEG